jgi:hypothetical protein
MIRLAMIRGDDRDLTVTLTNAAGEPIDLDDISDITFTAMLHYADSGDTGTTIVKTLGDGVVKDDPPEDGICTVHINPEDTESFSYGYRLMWNIRVVGDYEQDVRTVARGYLFVYQDVAVTSA